MKIIDISWPISAATTGYKDKNVVAFTQVKSFSKDNAFETHLTLSSHSGTHVDAPLHFLKDGLTIDEIKLDRLIGMATVLDLTMCPEAIGYDELKIHESRINAGDIILLKTANSLKLATEKFTPHFVYLHASGADYLASKKVKAVGIDYLGIERDQPGHETHVTLFNHDIVIIEGLRLDPVVPGRYEFYCLPLYCIGVEAAPARAILIER